MKKETELCSTKRKFIAIQSHIKKQENYQRNNLILYPKQLEREKQSPKLVKGMKS